MAARLGIYLPSGHGVINIRFTLMTFQGFLLAKLVRIQQGWSDKQRTQPQSGK